MKKQFNIKNLSIIIFTFICMFLLTNNVKAEEIYKCRYNITYENDTKTEYPDEWINAKDLLFSFEYNNGTYDAKLVKKSDPSVVMANDKSFAFVNRFFLNKDLTLNDLKTWDFSTKKSCPSQLWILWGTNSLDYFGENVELSYGLSFHQNTPKTNIGVGGENKYVLCTDQLVSQRGGDTPCEVVTIDVNNSIEGKEEEQNTYENKTCSYATMFEYENYGDTTTTLEFEITKNHINTVKVIDNHTVSYDFGVSDLNGECPKVLYSSNVSSDNFSISLQKNSESGYGYITKLGLIKTVTLEDPENLNETTDLCESLGPMEKYVRGAYSIIRFLIPIIIIVLSVIDFAGIVLSGETEKMEKAKKKFVLRLVIGILILFIPALLELLLKLAGVLSDKQTIADAVCGIVL